MVTPLTWPRAYRIIPSRFPAVGIFDAVADPADLEAVLQVEAATNPRVREEAGGLLMVRPGDRIAGPASTPIMAAFTHTAPSRFSDGRYGVYYAAHDEATAIAETAYHRARFLRHAGLPNERLDMRVYRTKIAGSFDDLRATPLSDPLYDPDFYGNSQAYAVRLHAQNSVDGIVFRSVRRSAGECVAAFRPRSISSCKIVRHLEYRFEDYRLAAAMDVRERAS